MATEPDHNSAGFRFRDKTSLPGWRERDGDQMRGMLDAFLKDHDSWVIDGTYSRFLFEERLEAADEIVILALPRLVCLARAWRRWRRHRGHVREDMAPGCEERLDLPFIRQLLVDGRSRRRRRLLREVAARHPDKTVVLRSRRRIDQWAHQQC
ncbi:MAG: hypothetical protein UHD09_07300 [Bifidobacterium sp.]|nr:hypothetical protein [Bifidobacterium sp.]